MMVSFDWDLWNNESLHQQVSVSNDSQNTNTLQQSCNFWALISASKLTQIAAELEALLESIYSGATLQIHLRSHYIRVGDMMRVSFILVFFIFNGTLL